MEFNKNIKPKLAPNIVIEKFSTSSIEQKHIITLEEKRFEIGSSIYVLVKLIDGKNSFEEIAQKYSLKIGKTVSLSDIQYIFENFLEPKGFLQNNLTETSETKTNNSYLYFRLPIISQQQLILITSKLEWLFFPIIFKIALSLIVSFHIYFYIYHNNLQIKINSSDIISIISIYSMFFLSTLFHELGHSSACKYYGAKHGNIGFGLYLYFPVFYANVTDVWKLPRRQRVVVDFAGIYFQFILIIIYYLIYIFTSNEIFLYTILAIEVSFIFNLNPFLRFDGYWIFSDLTGIPNLRQRSIEVISYLFRKITRTKNLQKPYIFNIGKKEQFFAYPYLIVTSVFFVFLFFRITYYLPHLLKEYPFLVTDTTTSIYKHIVSNQWGNAWNDFSHILFPTIIIIMLLFMSYRMIKRILNSIVKIIGNFLNKLPQNIN